MDVFNCPQCGAALEFERITSATVECPYCNSVVIVPADLRPAPPRAEPQPPASFREQQSNKAILILVGMIALFAGVVALAVRSSSSNKTRTGGQSSYAPTPTPKPDGYTVAFTFGGEGTGPGFFKDEMRVAVDGAGRIYVSDDTRRVQRFDASGKFINTWNIPTQTKWYTRLREGPRKLLVNTSGDVYAVVAGVVMKFDGATGEALGAAHGTDYIHDAALLPDGGMVIVSQKENDDELIHLGSDGSAAHRTHRFVSSLLDKELEVAAMRVAADGTGNAFALYAIGGLNGMHSYDYGDTAVFKFTPDGKYETRFGGEGHAPGQYGAPTTLAVDNESRVYVCESMFDQIHVFAADGRFIRTLKAPHSVDAITFDSQNNLYIAGGNKVSKLILDK